MNSGSFRRAVPVLAALFGVAWSQLPSASMQQLPANTVAHIEVVLSRTTPDSATLTRLGRDMVFLRPGVAYSDSLAQQSIDALQLTRRYARVVLDTVRGDGGLTARITLEPSPVVRDVRIRGEFPLFESQVSSVMTLRAGDCFHSALVSAQQPLIEELYRNEGFIHPRVEVAAAPDGAGPDVVVRVRIRSGGYYRVTSARFSGNTAVRDLFLRLRMKTWRSKLVPGPFGRFAFADLDADLDRVLKLLRSRGYADARVEPLLKMDAQTGHISIELSMHEGPHYDLRFDGNKHFCRFRLRRMVALGDQGNGFDRVLNKGANAIKAAYVDAGYPAANVRWADTIADSTRMVTYHIAESRRTRFGKLTVDGARRLSERDVRRQMLARAGKPYVAQTLEDDRTSILALYRSKGFLATEVKMVPAYSADSSRTAIAVSIHEGRQTMVSEVSTSGAKPEWDHEIRSALAVKVGAPFADYQVQADENALSRLVSEKGFPHVKVQADVVMGGPDSAALVVYQIDPGPAVALGDVFFSGNLKTRERFLRRELALRPGEPFSLVKMIEAQNRVRDIPLFSSVRFKTVGLRERADTVHLLVELEERKPYYLQAAGGYASDRKLYAQGRIGNRNMLGGNRHGWVGAEVGFLVNRGDIGWIEPRLLGTRFSASLNAYIQRETPNNALFGVNSFGGQLALGRNWKKRWTAGLGLSYERRDQFRRTSMPVDTAGVDNAFKPRNIVTATPSLKYDSRDFQMRPTRGLFSLLSVDVSKGATNRLDDFAKWRFEVRGFVTPLPRLTFALMGRAGLVTPYSGQAQVPPDQLFRLGGTLSVRGYDENMLRFQFVHADTSITSKLVRAALPDYAFVVASVESRIDLGRNFEAALFLDAGELAGGPSSFSARQIKPSAGLGLRYLTPIGAIGLLYGFKLRREKGESLGALHFSLGYTF